MVSDRSSGDRPAPVILQVWEPETGGVDLHGRALAAYQRAAGHDVHVLSPTAARGDRDHRWHVGRTPVGLVRAASQLRAVVREVAPDVIHVHSTVAGLITRLVVRGRTPTIFTPHAWGFQLGGRTATVVRMLERLLARWTDVVVAVGESEAALTRRLLPGVHVECVPNGIDLERFPPPDAAARATARERVGVDDAPTVVCVGRLTRQKGQDLLVAAWPAVERALGRAHLVLAGDGPDADDLRAAAVPTVRFLGDVSDVATVLHAADVVAQPSRWEGLSYSSIEALAVGLPFVAARIDPIVEVAGEHGHYAEPDDVDDLARVLIERLQVVLAADRPVVDHDQVRAARERFDVADQHARTTAIALALARG